MDDIVDPDRHAPSDPKGTTGDGDANRKGRLGPDPAANSRAFVVQVGPAPTSDVFCGRVQHLATLDGGNFSSPDELIAIMRRVLERTAPRDPTDDE